MKKLYLFLSLLFLTGFLAQAQELDSVLLNAFYKTIHVNDTNNRDKPLEEEMLLQLGKTTSIYRRAPVKRVVATGGAGGGGPVRTVSGMPMAVVNGAGITDVELYQTPGENGLNMTARLGMQNYTIDLTLPKIDWKISEETKTIGGYTCQKAVGKYAGRTYTAWFASELPFRNGPWKLSGLPGLILEATDAKNEVQFLFKEINKDTADEYKVQKRTKLVKVSEKAFNRAKDAFYENPGGVMQSQLPPGGPTVRVAYRDASGKSTIGDEALPLIEKRRKQNQAGYNNPIELKK